MELIWFDAKSKLALMKSLHLNVDVFSIIIKPADYIRDLGTILDGESSMCQQIDKLPSICFLYLCICICSPLLLVSVLVVARRIVVTIIIIFIIIM